MTPEVREAREVLARVRSRERTKAMLDADNAVDLARYAALCAPDPAWTPPPGQGPVDAGEEDLAATLTWTTAHASAVLAEAVTLTHQAPRTLAALRAGRTDWARARVVAHGVELLEPHQCAAVDAAVAPLLETLTLPQLRGRVSHEVTAVAPLAARRRHERGVRRRGVSVRALDDGLAELVAGGPATAVLAAREALRRRAARYRRRPGETRTRAAIEFDLLIGDAVADEPVRAAAAGADAARVQVTVDLPTVLGLNQDPAHLTGYGPVPADVARTLMTRPGTRLRRLVTDPLTGVLLGVDGHTHDGSPTDDDRVGIGAETRARSAVPRQRSSPHGADSAAYAPRLATSRFVRARDRTCTVPWCDRPATTCDLDHVVAHHRGGPTCACNLQALCRRHHRMKQRPGWAVVRAPDGTTTWTTPTGTTVSRAQPPALTTPVVVPDPADLVDHPPERRPDPRDDPDRYLSPDDLLELTDTDLAELLREPEPRPDPLTRELTPSRDQADTIDTDHLALRDAVHRSATTGQNRSVAADLGPPPF